MITKDKIGNELYVWIWERGLKKLLYKRWLNRDYGKVMCRQPFIAKDTEEFKQSVNDESLKARQVFEDMRYYNQVYAEAMRQVNRPKGWLIDPSRGNLMQIYTIYDEATAKYKGVSSLALCLQIIEEHSKPNI